MMMPAMARKSENIDTYLASLPDGIADIFAAVRQRIASLVPEADEVIKYGMPCWQLAGRPVVYAAAWKNHIGLYPVYRGDGDFEAAIGPYRDKKDTVRLVYSKPIPHDIIAQIVVARRAQLEAGS
jgi:uncharacterized protein YdhG (YjbR/CyaY superfamily)